MLLRNEKNTRETSTLVHIYVLVSVLEAGSISLAVAEWMDVADAFNEIVRISMLPRLEINRVLTPMHPLEP